jgi:hypothetical protein
LKGFELTTDWGNWREISTQILPSQTLLSNIAYQKLEKVKACFNGMDIEIPDESDSDDEIQAVIEKDSFSFRPADIDGKKTLPCLFPPTFKVQRKPGFVYKNQRTPSYTDRILFKSSEGLGNHITPLSYEPCVNFITSDHKPIRGAFSITPNGHLSSHGLDSNVHMTFRNIECEDLPVANSNLGKADLT